MVCTGAMSERDAEWMRVHRVIRELPQGEGPYAGRLVADGDGLAVLVPGEAACVTAAWRWAGAEHIAAPLDFVLDHEDGAALLPWCTTTLRAYVERRSLGAEPPGPGETVTVAVSLLRGLAELGIEAVQTSGEWWLTGTCRPVFVVGAGAPAVQATVAQLARLSELCTDRQVARKTAELAEALDRPRAVLAEREVWEDGFWECAAPRPLPELTTAVETAVAAHAAAASLIARSGTGTVARERMPWQARFDRRIDQVREGLRVRLRHATPKGESGGRGKSRLVLAAVVTVVVLGVGLLWPEGEDLVVPAQAAIEGEDSAEREREVTGEEREQPDRSAEDPRTGAAAVMERAVSCLEQGAQECPETIIEGSAVTVADIATWATSTHEPQLVDDYGDIAVLRLGGADGAGALIVLERRASGWLVRDLYEIADHAS